MKIVCRHGHFALYPSGVREVQRFMRIFDLAIYAEEDYYTFEALQDLPRWSQLGLPYGDLVAIQTYEGRRAWEVMRENQFVFSLGLETLAPLATVTQSVTLGQTLDCTVAPSPLVQPGAFVTPGVRLTGYTGELDLQYQRLYIYSQETVP